MSVLLEASCDKAETRVAALAVEPSGALQMVEGGVTCLARIANAFKHLFLAMVLATATPALAATDTEDKAGDAAVETPVEDAESAPDSETGDDADSDETKTSTEKAAADKAWAAKLRKFHHEGDVALGVCGARMSVLMWFYESLISSGRKELESNLEAVTESRTVLKREAERRAIDDGVDTSVSVMNKHSNELWDELVDVSDEPEEFQVAYEELYANVQECLAMFFDRSAEPQEAAPEEDADAEEADEDADSAEDDAEPKSD